MSAELLPCVEIGPPTTAGASVIWLHGLGADGHDFEGLIPELNLPAGHGIRFIFPHAPHRPVTINGGYVMRAWYDILGFDPAAGEDAEGIQDSADAVRALIQRERERGVPNARIVLAGFSQGGAIALYAGLRHPERLAGILALSSYLPLASRLPGEAHPENAGIPIFMAHGENDPVIALRFAQATRERLQHLAYRVEWRVYPMGHALCAEEVRDIRDWLLRVLSPR